MIAQRLFALVSAAAADADHDALGFARICLLDWLSCALAGASEPGIEALLSATEPVGPGQAFTLVGRAETAGMRDSVLINGFAGRAIDFDDGHGVMIGHPAVSMIPALLALAAQQGIAGEHFLRSIVAAYEAGARVGAMMGPDHYRAGFHATGTMGAIGCALGGAWMIGLPETAAVNALGIAATRAAGLKASFGTDGKPLHAAWANLVGLTAVQWARGGMTGQVAILEHTQGLGAAMSTSFDGERGLERVARPYIFATSFKQHAACGVTHPALRAALNLRPQIASDEVARVRIRIAAAANDICNQPAPQTGLALKFSVRGVVAMALLGLDTANPAMYSEQTCADPALRNLIARSEVVLDPDLKIGPTWLEVDLADGRTLEAHDSGTEVQGLDENRLAVAAKFDAIAAPLLGADRALRLREGVLESPLDNLPALLGLTVPDAGTDTPATLVRSILPEAV